MKKIVSIIIILISLFPLSGNAQFIKSFGFKLGVHFSNHNWNYPDTYLNNSYNMPPVHRFLFDLGVFGEFFSHKYLSFVSEINTFPKGAGFEYNKKDENGNVTGTEKVISNVNYFSFSEKIKARYGNKTGSVYCFAGPKLDLLFLRSDDADFKKIYDKFNNTVFGAVAGIGAEYKRFLIEAMYDTDISNSVPSESGSIRNYMISLRIGFKFGKLKNMY